MKTKMDKEVEMKNTRLVKTSAEGVEEILHAIARSNRDGEDPYPSLENIALVGGEELFHPHGDQGDEFWEVLWDLSNYDEEDPYLVVERAEDIQRTVFDLAQAGVKVVLVAGSCGLCDEEHFWVAAPAAQVRALLRRVQDKEVRVLDLPGIGRIPGVRVEYGEEVLLSEIPNSAGGYYERIARPITITISGRDDYNGVYQMVDVIYEAPWQVGGNSGEARRLWTSSEFEEQADWWGVKLTWD